MKYMPEEDVEYIKRSVHNNPMHWFALAASAYAYSSYVDRLILKDVHKSYAIGERARAIVQYDRIINLEEPC